MSFFSLGSHSCQPSLVCCPLSPCSRLRVGVVFSPPRNPAMGVWSQVSRGEGVCWRWFCWIQGQCWWYRVCGCCIVGSRAWPDLRCFDWITQVLRGSDGRSHGQGATQTGKRASGSAWRAEFASGATEILAVKSHPVMTSWFAPSTGGLAPCPGHEPGSQR